MGFYVHLGSSSRVKMLAHHDRTVGYLVSGTRLVGTARRNAAWQCLV
jgi:hypothetical protein